MANLITKLLPSQSASVYVASIIFLEGEGGDGITASNAIRSQMLQVYHFSPNTSIGIKAHRARPSNRVANGRKCMHFAQKRNVSISERYLSKLYPLKPECLRYADSDNVVI